MTLEEKFSKIVDNLLEKTEKGEIQWEPSAADGFATSRPDSSIVIEEDEYPDRLEYRISLYDHNGRRLETMSEQDLHRSSKLHKLYTRARRAALNVEALADTWLA